MAEEFAFRQAFGDRAAVNGNESEPATLSVKAVNGTGEYLFPRARLALQKQGSVADLCRFVRALQNGCHSLAGGNKS